MKKMKKNVLLIPFVAVLTLLAFGFVSADDLASKVTTEFNSVYLGSGVTMAGDVAATVPVRVVFDAIKDVSDVKVKVYMEGYRDDIYAASSRFDVVKGVTYNKLLSLTLPSDVNKQSEGYTLYVEIVNKNDRTIEEYVVSVQRESYVYDVLSVDYDSKVSAGETVPVTVVVKNVGYNRMDDTYVVVSIPELDVSSRAYVGDLVATESCDDNSCEEEEDSLYRTVYVDIPDNAVKGVYALEVKAYNDDAEYVTTDLISVDSSAATAVLASVKSQDFNAGETAKYDLIIVNSGDDVRVFNLNSISGDDLSVSVPSIVIVAPDSSETVKVEVAADSDAEIGTYTFSVDVDGESIVFGANIVGKNSSAFVTALIVALAIVLVVLLVVLVVLLTKKDKAAEEVETSYY